MTVKMTDDPAAYAEVNVEIEAVEIHYEDEREGQDGWVELRTNAGVYDLLELQNNVTTVIADEFIPAGQATQMRLILGNNNFVRFHDGSTADLQLTSQAQTGLKINVDAQIHRRRDVEILIDFDAEESIVVQGNGTLQLKPVVRVESVVYS